MTRPVPGPRPPRAAPPFSSTIAFDFSQIDAGAAYRLMIDCLVPRPIALISTIGPEGTGNVAPFSFFNGVASDPPTIVFSCSRKRDGEKKDTLRNIEANRQFVVNTVGEWMTEPMHQTSAEYPYGVDEMSKVGLTAEPSTRIAPPRVKESPVQMECELHSWVEVGSGGLGSSTLVIGRVLVIHVAETAYDSAQDRVRIEDLQPISRLGGPYYGRTSGYFEIPRPKRP